MSGDSVVFVPGLRLATGVLRLGHGEAVGENPERQRIEPDQPGELQHGGAGIEEHGGVRRQQPIGGAGDGALFRQMVLGALLERHFDR